MNKISKNKAIIICIVIIIISGIIYYIYTNIIDQKDIFKEVDENMNELGSMQAQNQTEESQKNIIVVHVCGAVFNEGIIELEEGSRVVEAIEKAGGIREDAYTKDINLATKLEDGMKIYIPTIDEYNKKETQENSQNYNSNIVSSVNSNTNNIKKETKSNKININTATQTELETLPGIGSSTALKIITYRKENGKFKTIEDIKNVSGIGNSKFNNIKDLIVV